MKENLVYAASCLDRTRNRQRVIAFNEPATGRCFTHHCHLQSLPRKQGRLDSSTAILKLSRPANC